MPRICAKVGFMPHNVAQRTLVIGHDGSAGATHALVVGLALADRLGASVEIVRAFAIADSPATVAELLGYPGAVDELSTPVRDQLISDTRDFVTAHPGLTAHYIVRAGRPADVLCALTSADRMLVVGSRGRGGFTGLLLGSVSNECLHRADGAVLVVPEAGRRPISAPTARPGDPADLAPIVTEQTIVVGHDGSAQADHALSRALHLAQDLDAPVVVIRSWTIDTAPKGSVWDKGYVSSFREISATVAQELERGIRPLLDEYPTVSVTSHGVFGGAEEVLLRSSSNARMLVLGNRGRGGFEGLLLGSVSTKCADRANCPVLVVPSRGGSD